MAMWNEGPFYHSDDGEGVYSDKELLYGIQLLFVNICIVNYLQNSWFHVTLIILTDSIIAARFAPSATGLRKRRLTGLTCPF